MKRNTLIIVVLAWAMLAGMAACGRPKTIPEDELDDIFAEMFLVNAYSDEYGRRLRFDSINIYEPILISRGYTTGDFTHTLAGFTKRRSARIDNVIEAANKKLTSMLEGVDFKIARENTIDTLSREYTREELFSADSIRVGRTRDTSRLRILLPAREGRFRIVHNTLQDSADENRNLLNRYMIKNSDGVVISEQQSRFTLGRPIKNEIEIDADLRADSLEIVFAGYGKKMTAPAFRIDSLRVSWFQPIGEARRLWTMQWSYDGVLADTVKYGWYNKNSANDSDSLRLLGPYIPFPPSRRAVAGGSDLRGVAVGRSRLDTERGVLQRPARGGVR